jgi:hypothetical protein
LLSLQVETLVKGSLAGFVRSALLGVCLLLSAAGSVTAAETKPDIALKSKAAAISVTLDPKIKTNAKLAAYLMADGKNGRTAILPRRTSSSGDRGVLQ